MKTNLTAPIITNSLNSTLDPSLLCHWQCFLKQFPERYYFRFLPTDEEKVKTGKTLFLFSIRAPFPLPLQSDCWLNLIEVAFEGI